MKLTFQIHFTSEFHMKWIKIPVNGELPTVDKSRYHMSILNRHIDKVDFFLKMEENVHGI